jgi:hypothetical protein
MKILRYNELCTDKIPGFKKLQGYLEAENFQAAEVKKVGDNLYRAKLDRSNRIIFSLYHYNHEVYALILEYIKQHAYEKSRFLNTDKTINEANIETIKSAKNIDTQALSYLNVEQPTFNLLDKIISFDPLQDDIFRLQPPLIIIGSAGSGKTALTLEKMKETSGDILYLTRSSYLVHNSRNLYYSNQYINDEQQIDFLSFNEYLESIHVPSGKEMSFPVFSKWFARFKYRQFKDPYQLFEEFKGVLTGPDTNSAYLTLEEYEALGIKQSIFMQQERTLVYQIFQKYLQTMQTEGYFDANILSFEYLSKVQPKYDFIIVDEVQDLTNIQLQVVLKSLRNVHNFILCGDANQIVHPNFFSWSKIKTLFYKQKSEQQQTAQNKEQSVSAKSLDGSGELIRILNTNYRNSIRVTQIANLVLKIKNARFGSVDKESHYLVKTNAQNQGSVILLQEQKAILQELDNKTQQSTRFAVIVMHPEQKSQAGKVFRTPLIFSIQEAKGLEYENIILYNFSSQDEQRFRDITQGVTLADLQGELTYGRAKNKQDKSLEIFKFHINALYVAITRAVNNIYFIESRPKQTLFQLLGLQASKEGLQIQQQESSIEDWRQEAHKLELQGKQEQAEEIRERILKLKQVPWEVLDTDNLQKLHQKVIEQGNKKDKLRLFEYALIYNNQKCLNTLIKSKFSPASNPQKGISLLNKKYFMVYESKNLTTALRQVDAYGVDYRDQFNQTPLMIASRLGNHLLAHKLIEIGADTQQLNSAGFNAFQIALEQAAMNSRYAHNKLGDLFPLLEPDEMVIQVDEQLIKLDNHLMEFLMINLMIAIYYSHLGPKVAIDSAIESGDIAEILASFPEKILPARRKKRAYISSILAKNEKSKEDRYNRKLFYRTKRGHYIINPGLSIKIQDEWRNIYDFLSLEQLDFKHITYKASGYNFGLNTGLINDRSQASLLNFRKKVQAMVDGKASSLSRER